MSNYLTKYIIAILQILSTGILLSGCNTNKIAIIQAIETNNEERLIQFVKSQPKLLNENSINYVLKLDQSNLPKGLPVNGHYEDPFHKFGWRVSPFGFGKNFHTGIDLYAKTGTPIKVTAPGVVVSIGWKGGYGNIVRIKHKHGYETLYAFCSKIKVKENDIVKRNEIIAAVGQFGYFMGTHCHYEIHFNNIPINPLPFMQSKNYFQANGTVLHYAVYKNNRNMVSTLLQQNADLCTKDTFGLTPTHLSLFLKQNQIYSILRRQVKNPCKQ